MVDGYDGIVMLGGGDSVDGSAFFASSYQSGRHQGFDGRSESFMSTMLSCLLVWSLMTVQFFLELDRGS